MLSLKFKDVPCHYYIVDVCYVDADREETGRVSFGVRNCSSLKESYNRSDVKVNQSYAEVYHQYAKKLHILSVQNLFHCLKFSVKDTKFNIDVVKAFKLWLARLEEFSERVKICIFIFTNLCK